MQSILYVWLRFLCIISMFCMLLACSSAQQISAIKTGSSANHAAILAGKIMVSDNGALTPLNKGIFFLEETHTQIKYEYQFPDNGDCDNVFLSLSPGDYKITALKFYQRDRTLGDVATVPSMLRLPQGLELSVRPGSIAYFGTVYISIWDSLNEVTLKITDNMEELKTLAQSQYAGQSWLNYPMLSAYSSATKQP